MDRPYPKSAGKAVTPSGGGSNAAAEASAKQLGLTKTSGLRTDEDVAKGIGYSGDDHHKGIAEDFAGPPEKMEEFAQWAVKSGQYSKVIWKGKDLISGAKVDGHFDHVHVSF